MELLTDLVDLAFAPLRFTMAATAVGIDAAGNVVDFARRKFVDVGTQAGPAIVHMMGLDGAGRISKMADELLDDDAPLGQALAPDGSLGRLVQPGGLVQRISAPGGMLERLTAEDGLIERLLAEEGLIDRLLAENGLVEKLIAPNGPLEQLADVADTLSRLSPDMKALTPTIESLRETVATLGTMVNPLSNFAERIPRPGRARSQRAPERVIDHQD